jgi:hypothetical protein
MMSPEDLDRQKRRKEWIESCFEEISKVAGPTKSKGAQRRFEDFIFSYTSIEVGVTVWWVATEPNRPLPSISGAIRVRWEQATPAEVAAAILHVWRGLQNNPMYYLSKRAQER